MNRTTACDECGDAIDLAGHIGRPPMYCTPRCRREGRIKGDRARRAARNAEIERLRSLLAQYAALAA